MGQMPTERHGRLIEFADLAEIVLHTCGCDTPRDSYCQKWYMEPFTALSKSVSWKPRKTSEEQEGRSNLLYEREKELHVCQ